MAHFLVISLLMKILCIVCSRLVHCRFFFLEFKTDVSLCAGIARSFFLHFFVCLFVVALHKTIKNELLEQLEYPLTRKHIRLLLGQFCQRLFCLC
jgi:hypothetical protein